MRNAEPPAVENEFVASDKTFDAMLAGQSRSDGVHWSAGVVDYTECLLDVELAGFAIAVDAVPIEQSICGIAGLLDFGDQETGAERVHGAGFDQNTISRARLELVETGFAVTASHLSFERLAVDAGFQAGVDFASGFSGE